MPEPGTLITFAVTSVLLVAIPGPNLVYIVTRSISQGRRAGMLSALGVETGTVVHVAAAVLGVSTLVAAAPTAMTALRVAGTAYLAYLGVRALRARSGPTSPEQQDVEPPGRVFWAGMVVNLLNPKVVLFFLAFLPQFVHDPAAPGAPAQLLTLGVLFTALALAIDLGYAAAAAQFRRVLLNRPRLGTAQRYLTATVYFALSAATALT